MAVNGRLVVTGLQNGLDGNINLADLVFKRLSVHGTTLRTRPKGQKAAIVTEVREKVWPMVDNGSVRLVVEDQLRLDEAAEAHRRMETGGHTGKILLVND